MFSVNEHNILQQSFLSFSRLGFCFDTSSLREYNRPREPDMVVKGSLGLEFNKLGVHILYQIVSYSNVVSQIDWGSYSAFLFIKIFHSDTPLSVTLWTCLSVQACACSLEILFTRAINN